MSEHVTSELGSATGPRAEVIARQQHARERAERAGYRALLVLGRTFYDRPGSLVYLTNHFPPFPATVFNGASRGLGHSFLLLPVASEPTHLIDDRAGREDILAVSDVRSNTNLTAGLISLLRERDFDSGQLGLVGEDLMPLKFYRELLRDLPGLDPVDADSLVAGLRIVKSPAEQQLLRRAGEIACAAQAAALATIGDGVTEAAVGGAGTAAALTAGADFVRYFRVHSGDWSLLSSRWPPASARVMRDGDVVTMDVIGAHGGYGFDVLRTTLETVDDPFLMPRRRWRPPNRPGALRRAGRLRPGPRRLQHRARARRHRRRPRHPHDLRDPHLVGLTYELT